MENQMLSFSPEQTHDYAEKHANEIDDKYRLVYLIGEVGSGKTTYTKGFVKGFGIDPLEVKSPTYAFYNKYSGTRDIYHFDLYRYKRSAQSNDLQLEVEEILAHDDNALILIEWPEKIMTIPYKNQKVSFEHTTDKNVRHIMITQHDK